MARFNSEETLWVIFPMILVIIVLIAGIIILPQTQTDVRSRASEPPATIITPVPNQPQDPEIVCSDLYSPVCGVNGQTYANMCEANAAGVTAFTPGTCSSSPTPQTTPPSSNLLYTVPTAN
jgi:hypothetical protein